MTNKYPLSLSTREACKVVKDIYSIHKSREIATDLMPEILGVKLTSSNFPAKIIALVKYGLIEKKPNKLLSITELGMKIAHPFGDEIHEAKLKIFRKDEVLKNLLERYPNAVLPSPEQLKATLRNEFKIDIKTIELWYMFIQDSFEDIKESLKLDSGTPGEVKNITSNIDAKSRTSANLTINNFQKFELPSGKNFYFQLDEGYSLEDLEFITDFFELKKKRVKN